MFLILDLYACKYANLKFVQQNELTSEKKAIIEKARNQNYRSSLQNLSEHGGEFSRQEVQGYMHSSQRTSCFNQINYNSSQQRSSSQFSFGFGQDTQVSQNSFLNGLLEQNNQMD